MLVTISRQYCAGGAEVAKRAAAALDFELIDNQFIAQVAERAGLTPEEVAAREERPVSFLDRFARSTVLQSPELFPLVHETTEALGESPLVKTTRLLMTELAARGRVVVVGRGAAAVLAHEENALHVRVVADKALRVKAAIELHGVPPKEAPRRIDEMDKNRARYYRENHHADWADPGLYHLILNTGRLGFESSAALVVEQARRMGA